MAHRRDPDQVPLMPIMTTCLVCGTSIPRGSSRCKAHQTYGAKSGQPTPSHAEKQRRRRLVEQWRAEHGNVCPGWNREPHAVEPGNVLTADHLIPQSISGSAAGELRVLCRRCNTARGGTNRLRFPSRRSR
jgi:5-methylcytosine-specific restriction protein A